MYTVIWDSNESIKCKNLDAIIALMERRSPGSKFGENVNHGGFVTVTVLDKVGTAVGLVVMFDPTRS